ncbi:MAG: hypothetical protein ACTSQ1_09575 [Promethearchaeota archaeon]
MKLSGFGRGFLLLALRIDKHNKGYVDFYFGPLTFHFFFNFSKKIFPKPIDVRISVLMV